MLNGTRPWTVGGYPQSKAFNWLTTQDTFGVETITPRQVLERYVLAVLYFSTNQPLDGSGALSFFLKPVSVCKWNELDKSQSGYSGVFCTDGTFVSDIQLSKFFDYLTLEVREYW